ncbi:hypothetical protein [Pseudoxanthomonas wuyuanensis]|uniref:hypothetical protein n=1 Tax=Pseudoxanthomonas wuyuanensis TaxID=1073196 RepID=UPI0011424604|nr:hypothetical protein [Pseudoxanthomonas wuyuanensis]
MSELLGSPRSTYGNPVDGRHEVAKRTKECAKDCRSEADVHDSLLQSDAATELASETIRVSEDEPLKEHGATNKDGS